MLRSILAMAALCVAGLCARAEFTAADALISMPAEIRQALGATQIADLVEYARAGMLTHAEHNAEGGEARILSLSNERAEVQTGYGRTLTLQLLPQRGDTVVALIETLAAQQPDSRLTVYSRAWQPMPKLWKAPKPSEWGKTDPLPILMIEYTLSVDGNTLTLTNNSEESEKMLSQMKFQWTPSGFKKLKE